MHRARFLFLAFLVGIISSTGCPKGKEPNIDERREPGLADSSAIRQRLAVRSYDGLATRQRLVVRDSATWVTIWQQLVSNHSPIPAVPVVDFASNVVIIAAMGTKNSGGYSIEIEDVRIVGRDARISVAERSPGEDCIVTAAITAPVAAVVAPRFPGQATFLERTEQQACR